MLRTTAARWQQKPANDPRARCLPPPTCSALRLGAHSQRRGASGRGTAGSKAEHCAQASGSSEAEEGTSLGLWLLKAPQPASGNFLRASWYLATRPAAFLCSPIPGGSDPFSCLPAGPACGVASWTLAGAEPLSVSILPHIPPSAPTHRSRQHPRTGLEAEASFPVLLPSTCHTRSHTLGDSCGRGITQRPRTQTRTGGRTYTPSSRRADVKGSPGVQLKWKDRRTRGRAT